MPTILYVRGWRVFFYSDEGREPIHVHAKKGGAECKYWLHEGDYAIEEAWSYNMGPGLRREVRKLILDNFELIVEKWNSRHGESGHESF